MGCSRMSRGRKVAGIYWRDFFLLQIKRKKMIIGGVYVYGGGLTQNGQVG
jgi:hypothetical protein